MTPLRYCFSTSLICFCAVSISWLFLLRNDHVIDADGNTGLGRFAEAELLEPVERDDRLFVTADLVAVPDQVTELLLAHGLVGEAHFLGPDFAEDHATHRGLDDLRFGVAVDRLLAEIRIRQANPLVRLDRSVRHREHDFARIAEEQQARFRLAPAARRGFGGQVIAAERDVLRRRHDRLAARGLKMLFGAIMSRRASICASTESGTCTAIWSPSKSAL